VGVRAPRRRVRARLRLPRHRLRRERDHRRPAERLQLRQGGRRAVDLEPLEKDAEEPAGREGVARSRDRLRDEAPHERRDRRPGAVHRPAPEGRRRARRARERVQPAGDHVRDRLSEQPAGRVGPDAALRRLPAGVDVTVRQGAQRPEGAARPDLGHAPRTGSGDAADGPLELPDVGQERGGRLPEARQAHADGPERPVPARPGGRQRRRHEGGARGVQGRAQARPRADGPAPDRCPRAHQSADADGQEVDSRPSRQADPGGTDELRYQDRADL